MDKPYRLSIYRHFLKILISILISISIRPFLKISISISIGGFQKILMMISILIRTFWMKNSHFSAESRFFHVFIMKYWYRLSIYWHFLIYHIMLRWNWHQHSGFQTFDQSTYIMNKSSGNKTEDEIKLNIPMKLGKVECSGKDWQFWNTFQKSFSEPAHEVLRYNHKIISE